MKHLQRQEQRSNLQRFPPPSCGTPPPPLSPSSSFFPASSGGSPGLFFRPQPTLRWHIAVGYRSTRLALRPHGTWCRCPRAAVGKGEEPSDETAACIDWSGSGEREMEEEEEKAVWIRWGSPCSAFLSVLLAVGARCLFGFSPPLLSRDFSLPFGNICQYPTMPIIVFCVCFLQLSSEIGTIQQRHVPLNIEECRNMSHYATYACFLAQNCGGEEGAWALLKSSFVSFTVFMTD